MITIDLETVAVISSQDWVALLGVMPVGAGGSHVWHVPDFVELMVLMLC